MTVLRHSSANWSVAGSPSLTRTKRATTLRRIDFALRDLHSAAVHGVVARLVARPMPVDHRPLVVVAPHADDETFGCGGLIATRRAAGQRVLILQLTDGRHSHSFDSRVDRNALVDWRRREALAAARSLGVPEQDVAFLGMPDRGLASLAPGDRTRCVDAIASYFASLGGPCDITVPHRRDAHPDHEAAYRLTLDALAHSDVDARVYQYSIWMAWLRPFGWRLSPRDLRGACRLDIAAVLPAKHDAIDAYISQNAVLPDGFLRRFKWPWELYFATEGRR